MELWSFCQLLWKLPGDKGMSIIRQVNLNLVMAVKLRAFT